jgi:hypothetical protein
MKRIPHVAACLFTCTLGSVCAQEPAPSHSKLEHRDNGNAALPQMPKDQRALAAYFRELASQEKALADSYERLATIYKKTKPLEGSNQASAREIENQYKRLAAVEATAATVAETVAAYHNRMADLAGSAPLEAARARIDSAAFHK